MSGKWIVFSVLAVAAGVGAGAFRAHWTGRRAPPPATPRDSGALVLHSQEITLTGNIRPQHVVGVGTTVEGSIEAFLADVGDEVFEGQALARIGSSGLETAREQAAAEVEHAQDRVTRMEAAIQTARLESSRADADALRARLRPGQPALVLVLDLGSAGLPGTVREVKDPVVVVEFAGSIPGIRPGMRADVRLKVE